MVPNRSKMKMNRMNETMASKAHWRKELEASDRKLLKNFQCLDVSSCCSNLDWRSRSNSFPFLSAWPSLGHGTLSNRHFVELSLLLLSSSSLTATHEMSTRQNGHFAKRRFQCSDRRMIDGGGGGCCRLCTHYAVVVVHVVVVGGDGDGANVVLTSLATHSIVAGIADDRLTHHCAVRRCSCWCCRNAEQTFAVARSPEIGDDEGKAAAADSCRVRGPACRNHFRSAADFRFRNRICSSCVDRRSGRDDYDGYSTTTTTPPSL